MYVCLCVLGWGDKDGGNRERRGIQEGRCMKLKKSFGVRSGIALRVTYAKEFGCILKVNSMKATEGFSRGMTVPDIFYLGR